jgi:hypothetical protein
MKAPAFYKNRPSDVDQSNLSVIPDAPRVAGTYPKNWDWKILETGQGITRAMKKAVNNSDSTDSAFGSAESTMKDLDVSDEVRSLSVYRYVYIVRTIFFCLSLKNVAAMFLLHFII